MNIGPLPATKPWSKTTILLMDTNSERRALRRKIFALHGVEAIGACDLLEASSIWHRDRYDMVLMDVRADHHGCMSWRNEIKKENPEQIVAFLVGRPRYVDVAPLANSYVAEEHGMQWGDSVRTAIRESCNLLPQRNGFVEAGWRIAAARKINQAPEKTDAQQSPVKSIVEVAPTGSDSADRVPLALLAV
jgi:CheY-like chemotaxis protein